MPLQMFEVEDFLKLHIYKKKIKTWVFELISRDFKENVLFPFSKLKYKLFSRITFSIADATDVWIVLI